MNLCHYKHIFGEPNKGIHSYRLFGLAIIDVVMTIVASMLISYFFHKSLLYTTVVLFLLGILLHRLFCVKTSVDKLLYSS
jgi:hypothetical protein